MKLSEIVYEDSKFRNIKHEESHLHNTYEIELKARKDIKDKLNNHPSILKKHAMVVEWSLIIFYVFIHPDSKWKETLLITQFKIIYPKTINLFEPER